MNSETGKRFGPYEILGDLGGGGMGVVYRAFDPRLHREVALKVLREQYDSPGMRERFLREARAVSALNHPNICTIFDIGEQNGDPYLVMELLHGETVRERIERGPMTTAEIVEAGTHIADALAEAHSKGIIHRDIKPANIFMVRKAMGSPQVKVLDFGLAKIQSKGDSFESENLTGTGATVGTVAYMSPEQARGDALDARSDLFSFGSLLYEMATGQLPFNGATSAMVFVALLSKDPDPVRDWNPSIPKELERIILKALTKDIRHRYRNAGEMRDALRTITAKVPTQARFFKPKTASAREESDPSVPTFGDPIARGKRGIPKQGDGMRAKPPSHPPSWDQHLSSDGDAASAQYPSKRYPAAENAAGNSEGFGENSIPAAQVSPDFGAASGVRPVEFDEQRESPRSSARPPDPLGPTARPAPALPGAKAGTGLASTPNAPVAGAPADSAAAARPAEGGWPRGALEDHSGPSGSSLWLTQVQPSAASRGVAGPRAAGGGAAAGRDSGSLESVGGAADIGYGSRVSPPSASYVQPVAPAKRARRKRRFAFAAALALAAVAGVAAYEYLAGHRHAQVLSATDQVLVGGIENGTGDPMLDGTLREAVTIELRQSAMFGVVSDEARANDRRLSRGFGIGLLNRGAAQALAQQQGLKAFVTGSVGGAGPYSVDLKLVDAQTGAELARGRASAADKDGLLDATAKAADGLRAGLGEPADAMGSVPLTQATTSSLEAFHDFAMGEAALADGDALAAIEQYQLAVALDPKFALACAQLAAADAAMLDMDQAAGRSRQASDLDAAMSDRDRMYIDAEFNMLGNHDLLKAAEEVEARAKQFPGDAAAPGVLAAIYNTLGRFSDAHAEAGLKMAATPEEAAGYAQEQDALIGLDRYEAASRAQADAAKVGVKVDAFAATVAYLAGNDALLAQQAQKAADPAASYRVRGNYALILDDSGQFDAAGSQWQALARDAEAAKLNGAAGYVLAQGAMDRALAGQCAGTLAMAGQAAMLAHDTHTEFRIATAAALCGDAKVAQGILDDFAKNNPQGTLVGGFYGPDIRGAMALKAGDPQKALDELNAARTYDLVSPTPYLRGLAHLASGQAQLALGDFQLVLAHRGASLVSGNITYSLAQEGVGEAYAAIGDKTNSKDAYAKFLADWRQADITLPLMVRAMKDSR